MTRNTFGQSLGIPPGTWDNADPEQSTQVVNLSMRRPRRGSGRAPGSALITVAAVLLGLLAAGLFVVSLAAQYRYVFAEKHQALPAMIEAIGLDVGMAIFSLLALGLAMAGQKARVERALIVVCALGSALMNYAAANGGSPRSVAAYVVPPVFLAIVVDRVVAVVRRHVVGDTERSAWAGLGRVALYCLRFVLAAPSTAQGLRRQVLNMTPLPEAEAATVAALPSGDPQPEVEVDEPEVEVDRGQDRRQDRRQVGNSKTQQFLALVQDRHGPLAAIDPARVSQIASNLAPEVGLHPGSARSALRPLVLAAQNGHAS